MSIEILHRLTGNVVFLFPGDTLRGANLRGADFRGADFRGADLSWADLSGADLSWADLSRADLSRADLRNADLSWADLRKADLRGADLSRADLSRADLRNADLRGVNLSRANAQTATGDWLRITGTKHAIHAVDEDNISIGCIRNTLAWWREHFKECGHDNDYTLKQIEEYRLHIEYAAQWLKSQKDQEC